MLLRMTAKLLLTILLALTLLWMAASESHAQIYFGKNKVQYTRFDWQDMTTDHFRVYFYTEEAELAQTAARLAEDSYRVLAARFRNEIKNKVPLIIYSSPSYFSQTNVIPGILPESVGGFTEFLKGRVVVPFNGSYADFAHVIRHEMVHVFMLSRLDAATERYSRIKFAFPPLWFTEGLAEYWSKDWDTEADMIVGDMIVNGRLFTIPNLQAIRGTFFMYKLGESILHFIDSTYGPDKISRLFDNWHKSKRFEEIVEITLGDDLKTISDKWEYFLKKKYYPQFDKAGLPEMESEKLTNDGYSINAVPIRWDDGHGEKDWIIFKANRMGYSGIYMKPAVKSKRGIKTLLKGERSSDFESLHLTRSDIDASSDGLIVFASKSKEKDVVYLYDLNKRSVTRRVEFENLIMISSPRLSPSGDRVVFSGVGKDGYKDIYVLNFETGDYRSITDDHYYDAAPDFSCDGRSIVFVSDRCEFGPQGATNLYRIDLATGALTQLTFGLFNDRSPDCTPAGVFFSSDRAGFYNLFLLDHDDNLKQYSNLVAGAINPRLSPDGTKLVYAGYQNLQFQIYQMDLADDAQTVNQPKPTAPAVWVPEKIEREYSSSSIKYDSDYSFDIAQSAVGYDPVYGSIGGIQAAISDILGNRAVHFLLTNTAETKDELLESFNFGLTYINREKRLNWGVGAFHLYDEYFNDYDQYYTERQAGAMLLISYPISKFHRVALTTVSRYSDKRRNYGFTRREAFLTTHYLSLVFDNSLWDFTGPLEGRRYNFTVGVTTSIDNDLDVRNFNRLAIADIRHYFRIAKYSAFANRMFAYTSAGLEPQRIYFGGSWSFRGFDRRHFFNRNVLFASNELRFPLIDNLVIGFPIGPLGFRGIRGALFYDTGSAWDDDFDQFYGSFGAGIRLALGGVVVLRFDFSRTTDYVKISDNTDFDFFFGWNF